MFQTHSAGAHDIAVLTYTMFAILSVVLITVWSLLAYVVIRFRHRTEAEASRTRGNTTIEVLWTAIPGGHRRRPVRPHHADHRQAHRRTGERQPDGHRTSVVVAGQLRRGRLPDGQRDPPAGRHRDHGRPAVGRRHPSVLVSPGHRQGADDPRHREPHQLPADHRRHLPRRVRPVLRHPARPHALPADRAAAGAVQGVVHEPDEARGHPDGDPGDRRRRRRWPACRARAATPSAGPA